MKYIVGVDEVGRGPIAGPVSVCALWFAESVGERFSGVKDSKKLSEKGRERWLTLIKEEQARGLLDFAVVHIESDVIDKIGIVPALAEATGGA
ncbi:MAG: ribonuclease HII, partial [Patescibacteria group bacterium]